MKKFKEFLAEIYIVRPPVRMPGLHNYNIRLPKGEIRDTPLSPEDHEDAIADIKAAMEKYPKEKYPTMHQGYEDKLKYHQRELAKPASKSD